MRKQSKSTGDFNVPVTAKHIDRALCAMTREVTNLSRYDVDHESAYIAGAIIANLEALDKRMKMSSLLMAVVHEVLTDFVPLWVQDEYGLVEPKPKRAKQTAKAA